MPSETQGAVSQIQESLFGTLAVRHHFVLEEQVKEALKIQRGLQQAGKPIPRLGEILVQRGYITADQVQAVLQGQAATGPRQFGEIAVALQFCPPSEVEGALQVQNQIKACGSYQRLGEILIARGALRPHQVHAVLKAQGKALITCPGCNTRLNVSSIGAGASVSCPRCKTVFRTPGGAESSAQESPEVRADMSVVMPAVGGSSGGGISRMANAVVGPYQLGVKLGTDSSGVLYKALDPQTGSSVAIRMLNSSTIANKAAADRWISAGEAASELSHPNLQRILSIKSDAGRVYMVMEFVEGESLRKSLITRQKFPVLEAVDVLIQMAEAVAYGHSHGFLHGDLRPAHVLIGFDGIVRVSGLGTPKSVALNLRQVAGQIGEEALPLYTAPEIMIDEESADERSDIYSLGAIGYQMLCGRPPHQGTNVLQVGLKVASEEVYPPRNIEARIPPYINRLICKCLKPEPDERYDSAASLLAELRQARQAILGEVADVPEIGAFAPRNTSGFRTAVGPRRTAKPARGSRARLKTHVARGGHGHATGRHATVGGSTSRHAAVKMPARPASRSAAILKAVEGPPPAISPPAQISPPRVLRPRGTAGSSETVDLLGDIDPLSPEPVRLSAPPPPEEELTEEEELEEELNRRRKKREGPPLDPGISTKTIMIGATATVVLVVGLIIVASLNQEQTPLVAPKQKVETTAPVAVTPAAAAVDPEASREWRLIQEHIQSQAQDYLGIVQRLEAFKLKWVDTQTPVDQAAQAKDQLKQYSNIGANATLPELRALMQKCMETEKFSDADKAIEKWKQQWRWDSESATVAKNLFDEAAAKQKTLAAERMKEAMEMRKQRKFDDAHAIYKRIAENYDSVYAESARKARTDASIEADATRGEAEREARARLAAEEQAARDQAAPGRYQQLQADLDGALKSFDLEQCNRLLDTAYELLQGTPQGPDVQDLRNDVKRLADVRDRIVKGIKGGKFAVPQVTYRNQQHVLVDCAEKNLTIDAGGKVSILWTELTADDLLELARRATNPDNGAEMMELGMLRYHLGRYREARQALAEAQRLGTPVTRYMPRVETKIKEAMKTPEPAAVAAPNAAPAAGPLEMDAAKSLATMKLEINRGVWKVSADGVMQAVPDPKDPNTDAGIGLMSLKRSVLKNFKKISIEVRGSGDEAGFSFGLERRYVMKPETNWQTICIERANGKISFTVDKAPRASLELTGKDVNADNLVSDGVFYVRFRGSKGEFRNIVVDE